MVLYLQLRTNSVYKQTEQRKLQHKQFFWKKLQHTVYSTLYLVLEDCYFVLGIDNQTSEW